MIQRSILQDQVKNKMNIQLSSENKINGQSNDNFTNFIETINVSMNNNYVGLKFISYSRISVQFYEINIYGIKLNQNESFSYKTYYESYKQALDNSKNETDLQLIVKPINKIFQRFIVDLENKEIKSDAELVEAFKYSNAIKWYIGII